jgi:hypothetical protein
MSALEEYREHRSLVACDTEAGLRICINKADAAIAELKAENARLLELVKKFAAQLIAADLWDAGGWTPDIMADLDPKDVA